MSDNCVSCGKELSADDIGMTKKLINRGAEEFFCVCCLAKRFNVSEEAVKEKIKEFKSQGCTLFADT